jgi:dolichyl-phosphate-mannose-protein mannosyltransferase
MPTSSNQTRMLSGVMFNYLTERMPNWLRQTAIGSILGVLVYSFKLFHPLAYGFADASTERNSTMFGLRWLETWEF